MFNLFKLLINDLYLPGATLIENIRIYMDYYSESDLNISLTDKEVSSIVSDITKELDQFGVESKIKGAIERSLTKLIAKQ